MILSIAMDESSGQLPSLEIMEQRAREEGALRTVTGESLVAIQPGDFDPAPPGQVRTGTWKYLERVAEKLAEDFSALPEGLAWRGSEEFLDFLQWKSDFDDFLESKSLDDLFALIPGIIRAYDLLQGDFEETVDEEEYEAVRQFIGRVFVEMRETAFHMINELDPLLEDSGGVLPDELAVAFASLLNRWALVDHTSWDVDERPVRAAGIFVSAHEAVADALIDAGWERADVFLGGHPSPESFFRIYLESGEGLPALKARYASHKAAIDARFLELRQWTDQQRQLAEPEP